ncbi:DUF2637 domain-containing protein [Amycolatopsis cihanbeyliensis]|uniref:Uncharacterized protein DUF2637 n=1 Tax=Amycolatopsis cihanbeyliensis TaxID=1128664 RepID=A0A542DQ79_AMYCI|nr:DUF2637 domain-containing protein [Amycolatopsis cihanbeyliensis]TQJ05105.1 uncharacterized protein DUF2637 [Amycolatopsis cihanbeyliensis]
MTTPAVTSSPRPDRALHLQCACTLLVAVGAAYVSYQHGHDFALRFGADQTTATLWPLIVDGLLTTATIELWKSRRDTTSPWKAWLAFSLGIALSLCANIASAPHLNPLAIAVAATPPLALLLAVELLNHALKRRHDHQPENKKPTIEPQQHPATWNSSPDEEVSALPIQPSSKPGPTTNDNGLYNGGQKALSDPLANEAFRLDAEHRRIHQRPISADALRRNLSIGSRRARTLTHQIRQQHSPAPSTAA